VSTLCSSSDARWRYFTFFTFRIYANRVSLFFIVGNVAKVYPSAPLSYFVLLAFARGDQIRKFDRRGRQLYLRRVAMGGRSSGGGGGLVAHSLYIISIPVDALTVLESTPHRLLSFLVVFFSTKSRIIEKNTLRYLRSCFYFFPVTRRRTTRLAFSLFRSYFLRLSKIKVNRRTCAASSSLVVASATTRKTKNTQHDTMRLFSFLFFIHTMTVSKRGDSQSHATTKSMIYKFRLLRVDRSTCTDN